MNWMTGLQRAIDYVEEHILEELNIEDVAAQSFSSGYHFQRVFSIVCDMTVGEYIRNRRLSLAGADLAQGEMKVIDVALKYGYDNPDSFARAFQRFHGVLPSQVRAGGTPLRSFSKIVLKLSMEGGASMNYRIEEKPEMILTEWMPEMGFELKDAPEIVVMHWMPRAERFIQIWLPIGKR